MSEVAEFGGSRSVYKRTPPIFGLERTQIADSSRTLRRRIADFVGLTMFEDLGLSQMPWPASGEWKGIGTSRTRATEVTNTLLRNYYDIREPDDTFDFVAEKEYVFPWLMVLYPRVKAYFPGSRLHLEAVTDPEIDDIRLVVFVEVNCSFGEAIERLDAFDKMWSGIVPRSIDQKITVTVEF